MGKFTYAIKFAKKKDALDFRNGFTWESSTIHVNAFRANIKTHNDLDLIDENDSAPDDLCFTLEDLKSSKITKDGDIWKLTIGPFENAFVPKKTTRGVSVC